MVPSHLARLIEGLSAQATVMKPTTLKLVTHDASASTLTFPRLQSHSQSHLRRDTHTIHEDASVHQDTPSQSYRVDVMSSAQSPPRAEGASTPPARRYSRTAVTNRDLQFTYLSRSYTSSLAVAYRIQQFKRPSKDAASTSIAPPGTSE
jgi:hypothetical protein